MENLIVLLIIISISWFAIGYITANIKRLKVLRKLLHELDIKDPHFVGKIEMIDKLNY